MCFYSWSSKRWYWEGKWSKQFLWKMILRRKSRDLRSTLFKMWNVRKGISSHIILKARSDSFNCFKCAFDISNEPYLFKSPVLMIGSAFKDYLNKDANETLWGTLLNMWSMWKILFTKCMSNSTHFLTFPSLFRAKDSILAWIQKRTSHSNKQWAI